MASENELIEYVFKNILYEIGQSRSIKWLNTIIIIPHVKIVSRNWLTNDQNSMLLCSRGNVKPLLVTPNGESASHKSSVTLTSSKTAGGLFPASATGSGLIWSAKTLIVYLCGVCAG